MRKPYRVTVRRMATGTDYRKTLWLKSGADAFDVMARHVRLIDGLGRNALRLIACDDAEDIDVLAAREALRIHAGIRLP